MNPTQDRGPNEKAAPRPSVALRRHHRANRPLLSLPRTDLVRHVAYRGSAVDELKRAARDANGLIRSHYAGFIHEVGRNVYPLLVFTDYEPDGLSGVGSTLTLYRRDGSVTKVSPGLGSNYEIYKSCCHCFMGLAVEVGPYLANPSLCEGDLLADGIAGIGLDGPTPEPSGAADGRVAPENDAATAAPWKDSLTEYVERARVFRQALVRAAEVESIVAVEGTERLEEEKKVEEAGGGDDAEVVAPPDLSYGLPPPEMRETMLAMLSSAIDFCDATLSRGIIDVRRWARLNQSNFPRIKECMRAATKAQADACVRQIVEWRDALGPEEWRELHAVIPTVWAVGAENPRKEMLRQLMDEDRIDTHIIVSEHPRNDAEARTLLGRVVGDRAIGRFVFGDGTREQEIKTMGLSSEVDVVQDDSLPAIWDAVRRVGKCPARQFLRASSSSVASSSDESCFGRLNLGFVAETLGHP